ncbi:hypothetical protein Pfo_008792 [Paulownia fortunei]|nr:hypothetical protein Pfo_008792 [Paulownia fortunei]
MNLDRRKQRSEYAGVMDSRLFEGSAFKECLNQEFSRQFQNLMHHENNDGRVFCEASSSHESPFSPIHRTRAGFGVSPGFYNPSLSYSGFNYSVASNAGFSTLGLNDRFNSRYFQQSSNQGGSSLLVASDGKNMPSLVDLTQISGEVVSPKQISSVTACSDSEWYSDKEPFEVGATFAVSAVSEPTSGDSDWIRHGELLENNPNFNHVGAPSLSGDNVEQDKYKACLPKHISLWIPEDTNSLSSKTFSKPKLSHEQLSQYGLQALQSKQCHLQPCPPPAHLDVSLEAQMYGCSVGHKKFHNKVPGEGSSKLSQLSLKQLHKFQQEGFCNVKASKPTDSIRSLHNILVSYLNYKSKLVDACRSRQEFVDRLHLTVCKDLICECEKYRILISHFDNCHNTDCNICGPVHQLCLIKKITSGSGKPKRYFSGGLHPRDYIIQETQPTPKRMKMENAVVHDDWSLGAVVLPHLEQWVGGLVDEENTMKMNKELLRSKESPTIGVTENGTADNGGPKSANVCFRKTDGLLGLGQSSEGPLHSATLNKEIASSIGNLGKSLLTVNDAFDNEKLGIGDAVSHSEELNLVDKQQEMGCVNTSKVKSDVTFSCQSLNSDGISVPEESPIDEGENTKLMSEAEPNRIDAKCDLAKSDYQSGTKLEDLKVSGVSLTDFFTAEQIQEHLCSLNQCTNLTVGKELTGNTTSCTVGANTCQLCAVDRLTFTAPPIYCASCGARIKHRLTYYWTLDEMGAQYCFCTLCFRESRGGNISFRGLSFSKAKLHKGKNTDEFAEAWVRCDKCERWQHQICALYNSNRDLEGKLNYICPFCRLAEIEAKEHVSIPPAFGAQDLPRTKLGDHIEQRLFRSLEQERGQMAEFLGKSPEEVPGAADLVVRVVLAVNKQLKVKQQFLDILHGETYPTEFPYKSKVILLFQKVEGVDVCLFAMYVQEFGSECGHPNKRSVYISYLDSVKYFRPEINTVAGVALRTFVYHEILIGYLDYCKQRGFTTCYIWACPPLRGEDYILYCHPETQKTPNPNKLLQWYKKALRKAKEENVVVEYTNFYDYFFVPSEECNSKITAARLPYFDGDYWSGAIEDMIQTIEKESGGDSERKLKNQMTKRTLKAMGHSDLSVDTTKDILVMQKLGHTILPLKEDFFVVHLQFTCTNCHEAILSGSRWSCNQCSKLHLCRRCLELKQISNGMETHTNIHGEKHQLFQIPVNDVAADTEDKDVLLDNDFFDNRHTFLNFCQKNHYQFDTLRRAKHSSMMILHHLHKMTALTMQAICSICHQDVMVAWHCEICSEFHVCNACYQKEGDGCHVHKLVQHLTKVDCRTKSEQMQQLKASEVRMLLDLLGHANQCRATRDNPCLYPKCFHVKKLFLHNRKCERRVAGGCNHCKKTWFLLHLHSQNCRDSNCNIPRCMDIKNHKQK